MIHKMIVFGIFGIFFLFAYIFSNLLNNFLSNIFKPIIKLVIPKKNNVHFKIENNQTEIENNHCILAIGKQFYSEPIIKRTKSIHKFDIKQYNNRILYNNMIQDLKNYSFTYDCLKRIMPPKSKSMSFLDELINNNSKNIKACCNPYCRGKIDLICCHGFDGYYCSHNCRELAYKYISEYWEKI